MKLQLLMNLKNQLIFFFSALGAFNGFLLSIYFIFNAKKKRFSNYFLGLLLLTLSIRITKSVFYYFNPELSNFFIHFGLSACILIGPFLYLYIKVQIKNEPKNWWLHVFPFFIGIIIISEIYPFFENIKIWGNWFLKVIYLQWFLYLFMSFSLLKPVFKRLLQKKEKNTSIDIWLVSIFLGVFFIWLAYNIASFTSYIVGALSFSFVMYLIILLFIFKKNKDTTFFNDRQRYKNKEIDYETLKIIKSKLSIVEEKELFCNPNLTLTLLAKELNISSHRLSQFINTSYSKSFTLFINEFRIEKAKKLLAISNNYKVETIGYECGFNSKSTFYTTFKKITQQTPLEYKKSQNNKV